MTDQINPKHYKDLKPEPIEAIEGWGLGFNLGNCVKYVARAGRKSSDAITDLKKAAWYLEREIWFLNQQVEQARQKVESAAAARAAASAAVTGTTTQSTTETPWTVEEKLRIHENRGCFGRANYD